MTLYPWSLPPFSSQAATVDHGSPAVRSLGNATADKSGRPVRPAGIEGRQQACQDCRYQDEVSPPARAFAASPAIWVRAYNFHFPTGICSATKNPSPWRPGRRYGLDSNKPLRALSLSRWHGTNDRCSSADRLRNGRRFGRRGHISATRPGLFVERH